MITWVSPTSSHKKPSARAGASEDVTLAVLRAQGHAKHGILTQSSLNPKPNLLRTVNSKPRSPNPSARKQSIRISE